MLALLKKIWNASRICVSSLRRGHANLLCIVPILVYVPPKRARTGVHTCARFRACPMENISPVGGNGFSQMMTMTANWDGSVDRGIKIQLGKDFETEWSAKQRLYKGFGCCQRGAIAKVGHSKTD